MRSTKELVCPDVRSPIPAIIDIDAVVACASWLAWLDISGMIARPGKCPDARVPVEDRK